MWFRLRLSPTHEFSVFLTEFSENLCWNHLDVVKYYPNHADHPLKTVDRLTSIFQRDRFKDNYLNHTVLEDADFKSILKDQDPTLYDKLIQLLEENQPITILPGIQDNFSWKKCICVEPCATGERTFQEFLKEYEQYRCWILYGSSISRFNAVAMDEEEAASQEPLCHCQVVEEYLKRPTNVVGETLKELVGEDDNNVSEV